MTIEEGEAIFGKRWSEWSVAEAREFVSVLTPEEARKPATLGLALAHPDVLPQPVKDWLTRIRPGWEKAAPEGA